MYNTNNAYTAFLIDGTFSDGSKIPNGSYRILIRALRVSGDAERDQDYDTWLSPIINVAAV